MATTFQMLYSRIAGDVPRIPLNRAQQAVQDAWSSVCSTRLWSFNIVETRFFVPNLVSAGTVSVTYGSQTITFNAAAIAALNAIPAITPITSQQFRMTGGDIYNILTYNSSTGVATIDNPFGGATNSSSGYQVYECYYAVQPPTNSVFLNFESILDPVNGYTFKQLGLTKADIDKIDPYRSSFDNPIYAASYQLNGNGQMLYEFWPHPSSIQIFQCLYRTNGGNLIQDSDPLPAVISRDLVESRAMVNALNWMELNTEIVPGAARINFGQMKKDMMALYEDEMTKLWKDEDERCLSLFVKYDPLSRVPGILTGSWLASHDGAGIIFPNL